MKRLFLFLILPFLMSAQEVVQVDTVADLVALNPKLAGRIDGDGVLQSTVFVKRYSTSVAVGVGAGTYVWAPSYSGTTNAYGGALAVTGGAWVLDASAGISPLQFGAVGDGETDDSAALNAMFASGFKTFSLAGKTYGVNNAYQATNASGYYWTNAVLAEVSGARITGPGTIRSLAETNVGIVTMQLQGDNNVVEGVTFDGNFTSYGESDTSGIGLRVYGSGNRIIGNTFTNTGYIGLQVESALSVPGTDFPTNTVTLGETVIAGNVFYNSHTTAILTKPGGLRRTAISDNIITGYALAGMKLDAEPPSDDDASGELTISGNIISDGDTALGYSTSTGAQGGITIEEGMRNIVISGNMIRGGTNTTGGAGFRGIYLSAGQSDKDVSNVLIADNNISNIDGEGILLRVEDAGRFDNVTISGGSITSVGGVGITTSTLGTTKSLINRLVINGAVVRDAPYGIQLTSVIQSADVSAQLRDIGASGIVVSSLTNCVIHDTSVMKYGTTNASARGIQFVTCNGLTLRDTTVEGTTVGLYGVELVASHSMQLHNVQSSFNRSHGILVTSSSTNVFLQNIFGRNNGYGGSGYLLNLSSGDDITVRGIYGVADDASATMPYVLVAATGVDVDIAGIGGTGWTTALYTFTGSASRIVVRDLAGYGSPESVVTAWPGATYRDMDGGSGTLYVKATGTGNTGWESLLQSSTASALSYSGGTNITVTVPTAGAPHVVNTLATTADTYVTFSGSNAKATGELILSVSGGPHDLSFAGNVLKPASTTIPLSLTDGTWNLEWKSVTLSGTNWFMLSVLEYDTP
jgi:hypothetical protein